MFIALSGVAVPACQHYEAGGSPERAQALRRVAPTVQVDAPPSLSSASS